jgi:uncharacterized damage-inducible protein DinB
MSIGQSLLPEFDIEMANTRRTLERVPDEKFSWKPHPKSAEMGWLANHLSNLASWSTIALTSDSLDVAPKDGPTLKIDPVTSTQALLQVFDKNVADARAAIGAATDEQLMSNWTLLKGGQTVLTLPKVGVLRSFVMNHMIHHRAQLTVYLRLNDVPVPSIYGPSADEGSF